MAITIIIIVVEEEEEEAFPIPTLRKSATFTILVSKLGPVAHCGPPTDFEWPFGRTLRAPEPLAIEWFFFLTLRWQHSQASLQASLASRWRLFPLQRNDSNWSSETTSVTMVVHEPPQTSEHRGHSMVGGSQAASSWCWKGEGKESEKKRKMCGAEIPSFLCDSMIRDGLL